MWFLIFWKNNFMIDQKVKIEEIIEKNCYFKNLVNISNIFVVFELHTKKTKSIFSKTGST